MFFYMRAGQRQSHLTLSGQSSWRKAARIIVVDQQVCKLVGEISIETAVCLFRC